MTSGEQTIQEKNLCTHTWSKPTPFTARRIDYIFCDTTSLTKIMNTSTEGFPHSDHKLVKVKINMNIKSFKGGPGYWKFNSSLLSEADFVADNIINTHFSIKITIWK